ncbi:hypothetical protein quinque_009208 [Culex quinquefasciatus]
MTLEYNSDCELNEGDTLHMKDSDEDQESKTAQPGISDDSRSKASGSGGSDSESRSGATRSDSETENHDHKKSRKTRQSSEDEEDGCSPRPPSEADGAQRMAREASVSVPYHKPKQRTLEEFLNRRTVQNPLEFPVDGRQSLTAAIRMPPEQLEAFAKYLEEREKETIEFFKSDNVQTPAEEPVETTQEVPVSEPKATTSLPAIDTEPIKLLGVTDTEPDELPNTFQDIQEKLAINAIQKSLMQIENVTSPMQYSGSPPAYPMHGGGMSAPGGSPAGGSQQAPTTPNPNFTPPPVYTPRVRMSSTGSSGGSGGGSGGGPSGGQMGNGAPGGGPNALTIQKLQNHQQQRERIHQEQQRQPLLQQQKQQQMVVPVNATANADMNLGLTPGMQNIESLLNNTVAPNVSLTRANSVVPDSQLSPGFSPSQLMQQQLSPNQRTQLSPQQTGFQGSPFNNNPVHRMSPQQVGGFPQQQQQQQQPGTPGSQQLSPRQPPFASNPQVSQPNALQQQQQWQNANARLSIQQQNPMLNAQLSTIPGYNPAAAAAGRQQFVAPQRQRSLNSPGTPRQGSFGGTVDGGGFPGPPSPSQPGQNFNNPAVFAAAAQQMRLQRQGSVPPQATQHLPGSPRPSYGGHGPGPDAGGYGMMFSQAAMQQHTAGSPGDYFNRVQTGGANGGGGGGGGSNGGPNVSGLNSSELVRQELRAVVSGRAQNAAAAGGVCGTGGLRTPQSPIGMSPGMVATAPGGPGGGGGNVQGPGSASSGGGGGGGGIGGNGDSMQTSQLPGTSSSSSLLHPAGDMDPSMLFNFHLTPKEFFGGNTSR